ncbi:MAG: hypothetical protein GY780_07285 [bacterium]|nr:hypothetical protein [bacterium]
MRLNKLQVHRLPGIPGGFTIKTPATVNIITGPNGIGKSSLVRAVRKLLWSHLATEAPFSVEAFFDQDNALLKASRDEGRPTRWWRDSVAVDAPHLPGEHVARCYELGVLDLVLPAGGKVEKELARVINREMSGGVNLDDVAQSAFSFSSRLASNKRKAWKTAQKELGHLNIKHKQLAQQEQELIQKNQELKKTENSGQRLALVNKLQECREIGRELVAARKELGLFASCQEKVRPDDSKDLADLHQRHQRQSLKIADQQTIVQNLRKQLSEKSFPANPITAHEPGLLTLKVREASGLKQAIDLLEEEISQNKKALQDLITEMDPNADNDAAGPNPDSKTYSELAKIFSQLMTATAGTEALKNLLHLPGLSNPAENIDQTNNNSRDLAIEALTQWLREPPARSLFSSVPGIVTSVVAALAGWFFYTESGNPLGLATTGTSCLLLGYLLWKAFSEKSAVGKLQDRALALCRQADLKTSQPLDRNQVFQILNDEISAISASRTRAAVREFISNQLESKTQTHSDFTIQLESFRKEHGLAMDRETPELLHLLNVVPRFRKVRETTNSLDSALEFKTQKLTAVLQELLPAYQALGLVGKTHAPITETEAIRFQEILENRVQGLQQLQDKIPGEEKLLLRLQENLKDTQNSLDAFWARLGRPTDTEEFEVLQLVKGIPAWEKVNDLLRSLKPRHEQADLDFRSNPNLLDPDYAEGLDPDELRALTQSLQDEIDSREIIQGDVKVIEYRIQEARTSLKVAEATAIVENNRTELFDTRDQERKSALGQMILHDVEETYHHSSRPKVLSRAIHSFNVFSQGRYQLAVVPGDKKEGTFQALNAETGESQNLGELSDGTRSQLLLAVRLAFISENETGNKPPIFLDESLTSADPQRFAAIAENLAQWAETENRQVFYLTTNPADATAWQLVLQKKNLAEPALINLAQARKLEDNPVPHVELKTVPISPAPDNLSPAEYANLLMVPQLDPWQPAQQAHLWYILKDDLEMLHRFLLAAAPTVGRFLSRKEQLSRLTNTLPGKITNLEERGKCLTSYLRNWRLGRGRTLTPAHLCNSPHISERYLENCRRLLDQVHGNAGDFLDGLRNKHVSGFRAAKMDQLEEDFRLEGFLDDNPILNPGEILQKVLDDLKQPIGTGHISITEVNELVSLFEQKLENKG